MEQQLLFVTKDETTAKAEIEKAGGRVVHQFNGQAVVAELPSGMSESDFKSVSAVPKDALDDGTQLAVAAWRANQADAAGSPTPQEGLKWDTDGFQSPRHYGQDEDLAAQRIHSMAELGVEAIAESTGTPTSLYLVGSVAVGLVLVSRNSGPEVLSSAEQLKIVQEVQRGLNWLATLEPRANVSFAYDIKPVTVNVPPGPYGIIADPYERMEQGWRDAALAQLGFPGGRTGYQAYANSLCSSRGTDWGYVAFFTKYELNHFAYAIWEKVVMSYFNDGWGIENLHRVFAHESCHVFGAADEYGNCQCNEFYGYLQEPNRNCTNCPGNQEDCLMTGNTLSMCGSTRRQIGWGSPLI